MKVLVTGANGFLGSWIVKGLLKRNYHIRILHRANSDLSSMQGLPIEAAVGDITDFQSLDHAVKGVDYVFHAAGLISYNHLERKKMELVNVTGTENVIKACLKHKTKRLVYTSSVVAVGASAKKQILNESSPYTLSKYNLGYFETKKMAENRVLHACSTESLDAVILNPSSMFGPGDGVKSSRKKYLRVAQGNFPYYPSGGVNILDVEDAVDGHISALEKGRRGERYILGAENISVKELFEMFAAAGGSQPPAKKIPAVILKAMFYSGKALADMHLPGQFQYESAMIGSLYHWFDNTKAKKELGFNPRPARAAIKRSVDWCFENGLLTRQKL